MNKPRCFGVLSLALASCLLALPAQAARKALVIGNDAYTVFSKLRNAVKDARDVAAELRAAGFEVPAKWLVTNGSYRQMDAAVQDFLAQIGPQDEVVFYYSGHGVEIDAQAALIPVDLSNPAFRPLDNSLRPLSELPQAKQQVLRESVVLNDVAANIAAKNVKFSLLIVDACRNNPVLELLKTAHASNPRKSAGPAPQAGMLVDPNDGQMFIFSAAKGQESLDRLSDNDPERNGVFTRVLLKAMRTPGAKLRDMLPKIRSDVASLAATVIDQQTGRPHQQNPKTMAAADVPDFYFRQGSSAPIYATDPEQEAWDLAKRGHTAGAYEAYVRAYPQGRYAQAAQVALAGFRPVQIASIKPEPVEPSPQPQPTRPAPATVTAGQVFKDCQEAHCPEMVVIPAGTFTMGSNDADSDEKPPHSVTLKSFALGKYEVTQGQWKAVMGNNPNGFSSCGDNCPVEQVSWDDIQQYIQKLNQKTGQRYRLPSEAEWEYAARAGTKTKYWWGDTASHEYANYGKDACCRGLAQGRDKWEYTAPVGQFPANAFGLYDMHGNVREWVQDYYHDSYSGAPKDGSAWVSGGEQKYRVLRGGSWYINPADLRSANRSWITPHDRASVHGFRLARTAP